MLADKAETLGLEQRPIVGIINQASSQLGLDEKVKGATLINKADACLSQLGVSVKILNGCKNKSRRGSGLFYS